MIFMTQKSVIVNYVAIAAVGRNDYRKQGCR